MSPFDSGAAAHMTRLRQVQLDVADGRTLDDLGALFHDALDQDDALVLKARGPLDHLFAHFLGGDGEQCLDGVGALAEVEEDHLVALCARGLHTSTQEHGLSVHVGVETRDLSALPARTRLRLIEGLLAIEFGGKVLPSAIV